MNEWMNGSVLSVRNTVLAQLIIFVNHLLNTYFVMNILEVKYSLQILFLKKCWEVLSLKTVKSSHILLRIKRNERVGVAVV